METSTRKEPNDRKAANLGSQPPAIGGKAKAAIRCRLCRETIALETDFRPTAATCPQCGLKFVFDPQQEPLPVRGLRLHYAAVLDAQRRPRSVQHIRHDAHVHPAVQVRRPKTNYLAWAGGLALSLAVAIAFFGSSLQRLLAR
jgi:hypothetical protein